MSVKISNKWFLRLSNLYWLAHVILLWYMPGFGIILKGVALLLFVSTVLNGLIQNEKYNTAYSIFTLIYSIIYTIINCVLCLLFPPKALVFIIMLFIVILNYVVSILNVKKYDKDSELV